MDKEVVYRIEDGMDREKVLCTTCQMRNFYSQFRDGYFTNLDVMNYIQHFAAALMAKKGGNVVNVCCGRSLMLPLLRYYAKNIRSYTGIDISKTDIKEAMRGAKMFLSCPNTPGNGYDTQYRAHVYEWGYDELKSKLKEIGFAILQEVGLVAGAKELDALCESQPKPLKSFYKRMRSYVPTVWLTAFMAIPFPKQAKELLFIVEKPKGE